MCTPKCDQCGFDPSTTRVRRLARDRGHGGDNDTVPIAFARRPGAAVDPAELAQMLALRPVENGAFYK